MSLRKKIKNIEYIVSESKNSPLLLDKSSSSTPKAVDKESSSGCTIKNSAEESNRTQKEKEIDDMHGSIEKKVFGRDKHRERISRMLREGADIYATSSSSSSKKPYSVIGIYGISGSGKSTLAQYVCDNEKVAGHFDPIIFVRVGRTFSVGNIFRDMLEKITGSRPSNDKDLKSLKIQLQQKLRGKRFLLVLDDVWVNDDNQKERDILLDTLNASLNGSRVLVTAQKTDAAKTLGAQKQFPVPDLEEEVYLTLLMHHARPDASDDDGEYRRIGKKIANKLHRSPIAAVTVGKQLQRNNSTSFWETTANLDVLNKTMGALWWSYQQLGVDVRRCFAYCSTFPRGYFIRRDELVGIWIAQGFVDTRSNAVEELEDVGQCYFDQLLTFSFFSKGPFDFTIHDLLYELAERVSEGEFSRIGLNGSPEDIPRGVRHLFIETKNVGEINEKILDLGNLSTLIIDAGEGTFVTNLDLEKVLGRLFMRLKKLRVLIIKLKLSSPVELSIPTSVDHTKHLRYLGLSCFVPNVILPSTFNKLYHIQTLRIPGVFASYPEDMSNLIYLRHISTPLSFPNVGRLTSLQAMTEFTLKEAQGYELKQLKDLNKLRGTLSIRGLEFVRSKEDALEAHLTHKERLTVLQLDFGSDSSKRFGPDVEAEVLEGLCPPKNLQVLDINCYKGSRYPSWILSKHHPDAPKHLHRLELYRCSQLAYIPEDSELFNSLRELKIMSCDWDRLPENMERLESLRKLHIWLCNKLELLPRLPHQSLKSIIISRCYKLRQTCEDPDHQNWRMIQHIPFRDIE